MTSVGTVNHPRLTTRKFGFVHITLLCVWLRLRSPSRATSVSKTLAVGELRGLDNTITTSPGIHRVDDSHFSNPHKRQVARK